MVNCMAPFKNTTVHAPKNLRVFSVLCLLFSFLFAVPAFAEPAPNAGDMLENYERKLRETAEMLESATIWVITMCDDESATGSGFVISDEYILTNGHVVDCKNPVVYVSNSVLPLSEAKLIDMVHNPESFGLDFALLKYNPPEGLKLPVLTFNTDLRRMDRVSAWGYPAILAALDDETAESIARFGTKASPFRPPGVVYTEGAVSTFIEEGGATSIVHTAAIHSGNSGGPLVNRKGEVVGINTWAVKNSEKGVFLNCSLRSSDIIDFLRDNNIEPEIASPTLAYSGKDDGQRKGDGTGKGRASRGSGDTAELEDDDSEDFQGDARVTDENSLKLLTEAEGGMPEAALLVGLGYLTGEDGFPEDFARSAHWLEKAGDVGDGMASAVYGILLIIEPEIHDPEEGLELLEKYSMTEGADPAILGLLAQLYLWGETSGVPYDAKKSFHFAEMAAEKGDAAGMGIMAYHYLLGSAVEQDQEKAADYAGQSAAKGDSTGASVLASLAYFSGDYEDLAEEVLEPATAAANEDDAAAQGLLATIYAFDEQAQNLAEAEQWAQTAARNSECQGEVVMGWLYLNGHGVQKSLPLAKAYLDLASKRSCLDLYDLDALGISELDERLSEDDLARADEISQEWREAWGLE